MTNYVAEIKDDETWHWKGDWVPPMYKNNPYFIRGDQLTLGIHGCGDHEYELTLEGPAGAAAPFKAPCHSDKFRFPSAEPLVFVGLPDDSASIKWKFSIGQIGGKVIDPEFHVGPGGPSGTQTGQHGGHGHGHGGHHGG